MEYSLGGLRPRHLKRKAQQDLMEHRNVPWNFFCSLLLQKYVIVQVSSAFLHYVEQAKVELAKLGEETRNLRTELQ